MQLDTHYSKTIEGDKGEADVFVSKDDGIQIGMSSNKGSVLVDFSLEQAIKLKKALSEAIQIQEVYEAKAIIIRPHGD